MMHEAKQVLLKSVSDGAIAVLMRCCGDTSTDQCHTLYLQPETTDQEIQDWLADKKATCERMHAARERAHAIISKGA